MFDLVADIERYPEFLPHCVALRIIQKSRAGGNVELQAEMVVAYRAFREQFHSKVRLDETRLEIDAEYLDGPFKRLRNEWRFHDDQEGSRVDFLIDFEFRSFLLQATAKAVFDRAFIRMSEAFVARADALYAAR